MPLASVCGFAAAPWLNLFSDKAAFITSTNAPVRADISTSVVTPGIRSFTRGDFLFETGPHATGFRTGDYHTALPGRELVVDASEDINISTKTPMSAFGFDFVELQNHASLGAPFVKSTFTLTMKYGTLTVASFTFTRPTDSAQFVGVIVPPEQRFDHVEIRETIGGVENELFGRFYGAYVPAVPNATIPWVKRFDDPAVHGHDAGMDICEDRAGYVFVTGNSVGIDGFSQLSLTKYRKSDGRQIWQTLYHPRPAHFGGIKVRVDGFGNPFVVASESAYYTQLRVIKFDGITGTMLWETPNSMSMSNTLQSFVVDAWGNPAVLWNTPVTSSSPTYIYNVMRINGSNGVKIAANWFGGYGAAMTTDNSGNLYIAGNHEERFSGKTYNSGFAVRLDSSLTSSGLADWSTYGTTFGRVTSITPMQDGTAIISGIRTVNGITGLCTGRYAVKNSKVWEQLFPLAGYTNYAPFTSSVDVLGNINVLAKVTPSGKTNTDYLLLRYDFGGVLKWSRLLDGPGHGNDTPIALGSDAKGNPVLVGTSIGTGGLADYYATMLNGNSKGTTIWEMTYNGPAILEDSVNGALITTDGDVYMTGSSSQGLDRNGSSISDMATVKVLNLGLP